MKTCIIHIGFHKTGTTALQKFCLKNADVLAKEIGVQYFTALSNHSYLSVLLEKKFISNDFLNAKGFFIKERKEDFKTSLHDALIEQASTCNTPYFMLSGEKFSKSTPEELETLKSILAPYFDEIRIVSFVREPRSFINSYLQQLIRKGITLDQIHPKTLTYQRSHFGGEGASHVLPMYKVVHQRFAKIFGEKSLTILDYTRMRNAGGSVVDTFFSEVFGVDDLPVETTSVRENQSVSKIVTLLLERINHYFPPTLDGKMNRKKGSIGPLFRMRHKGGDAFALDEDYFETEQFASLMRDEIEWLYQFTKGRIDYRKSIRTEGFAKDVGIIKSRTQLETELLETSAKIIGELLYDVANANHKGAFHREILMLRHMPERPRDALEGAIMGITDSTFLLTGAHLLRLEGLADVAILALECAQECVDDADEDQKTKIANSMKATRGMVAKSN